MSSKGKGTQGYRYYMSLLSGLCRGPINEVVEIQVGDKPAWLGKATDGTGQFINSPNLFGGDDKEGGIQGPFAMYGGAPTQVIPEGNGLPSLRGSIGGLVSQMRGVAVLWFDGLVSSMNPYLKTWKFRVRRSTAGWHNDNVWYPEKCIVPLGGNSINVTTNRKTDLRVTENRKEGTFTITFARNVQQGDTVTINGTTITYVKDDPAEMEIVPNKNRLRSVRNIANYVNARSPQFKAVATYTDTTATFAADAVSQNIVAMNGAHIIFQCFTDPLWGRGLRWSDIGLEEFTFAADTLWIEGFGVTLIWYRKEDIDQFIQKVLDLIGGVVYTDRQTGKICLKLIRNDYDIKTIPFFTPGTGLLAISDDDSGTADNTYNEIIGTSRDPVTNLDFQVRAQNLAGHQAQGSVSSLDQDYKGVPTKPLLQRLVLRDMRSMAAGLKKYTIELDRRAWRITPGSVIRISHPGRKLENLILRVADIDDGNMLDGRIIIKAAVDVFGLPRTAFTGTVESGWAAPSTIAVPALEERLIEASYRDLYRSEGGDQAAATDPLAAFVGQLAVAPNKTTMEYDLLTRADGEEFADRGRGVFTGNARLATDITPLQTVFSINSISMLTVDNVGEALLIDDELVRLDGIVDKEITVTRGVGDTIPVAHEAAAIVWTVDDDLAPDGQEYTGGETVYSKVLTRTSSQALDADLADELSVTLVGRQGRPYPPADVRVRGDSIYGVSVARGPLVISWAERNRITQGDILTGYSEATIAPEAGQTYTIRVYGTDDVLLRTVEDIVGTSWTYTKEMSDEDNAPVRVWMELESVRDGLASWQHYRFQVTLSGTWGFSWGSTWG